MLDNLPSHISAQELYDNLVEVYLIWQKDIVQHELDKAHYARVLSDTELQSDHPVRAKLIGLGNDVNERIQEIQAYMRSAESQFVKGNFEEAKARVLAKWEASKNK